MLGKITDLQSPYDRRAYEYLFRQSIMNAQRTCKQLRIENEKMSKQKKKQFTKFEMFVHEI